MNLQRRRSSTATDGSREDDGSGYLYGANFSFAQAPNEKLSWRLSAGYFNSDPYSRPGTSAGCHPGRPATHPARLVDQDRRRALSAGPRPGRRAASRTPEPASPRSTCASTGLPGQRRPAHLPGRLRRHHRDHPHRPRPLRHRERLVHDLRQDRVLRKGALKVNVLRELRGRAARPNLLLPDPNSPTLEPLQLNFKTQTYDFEIGHSTVLGGQAHPELRRQRPAQQLRHHASRPQAEDRNEFGAYLQEEFFVDKFRVAAGARVDKFGNLDKAVFSPRLSVMFKPTPNHSIRASFNRAFRAPVGHQQLPGPRDPEHEHGAQLRALGPAASPRPAAPGPSRRSSSRSTASGTPTSRKRASTPSSWPTREPSRAGPRWASRSTRTPRTTTSTSSTFASFRRHRRSPNGFVLLLAYEPGQGRDRGQPPPDHP